MLFEFFYKIYFFLEKQLFLISCFFSRFINNFSVGVGGGGGGRHIDTSPGLARGGCVSFWTCWREISGNRVDLLRIFNIFLSDQWLIFLSLSVSPSKLVARCTSCTQVKISTSVSIYLKLWFAMMRRWRSSRIVFTYTHTNTHCLVM